jgi:pimeloyl-ACP methyl ester carboxylesterase
MGVPIMIMGGGADKLVPPDTQPKPMYEGVTSAKYLVILEKANHLAFSDKPGFSGSPAAFSPDILEQVKVITSAFWLIHLKNESRYAGILTEYVATQPDVKMLSNVSQ